MPPNEVIDALTVEIEKANPSSPPAATAEAGNREVETDHDDSDDTDADEGAETGEAEGEQGETTAEQPKRLTRKERRQARFNEAIVARRQAETVAAEKEREAAYWRQKATEGTSAPAESDVEKTIADFKFDADAYKAYIEDRAVKQRDARAAEEQQAEKIKQAETQFEARSAAFAADHPDYGDVAFKTPLGKFYSQLMVETIRDSELGPQLAYYLGQNIDKTDALLRMTDAQQAKELGKIEARLEGKPASTVTPITDAQPPRTVTRAPAVGSTVHATSPGTKALGEMSVQEHIEAIRVNRQR